MFIHPLHQRADIGALGLVGVLAVKGLLLPDGGEGGTIHSLRQQRFGSLSGKAQFKREVDGDLSGGSSGHSDSSRQSIIHIDNYIIHQLCIKRKEQFTACDKNVRPKHDPHAFKAGKTAWRYAMPFRRSRQAEGLLQQRGMYAGPGLSAYTRSPPDPSRLFLRLQARHRSARASAPGSGRNFLSNFGPAAQNKRGDARTPGKPRAPLCQCGYDRSCGTSTCTRRRA